MSSSCRAFSSRPQHFQHPGHHLDHGHVESATFQVVDHKQLLTFRCVLRHPVGIRCRRGLVEDAQHVQSGNLPRLLGRCPLGVLEVGRAGDDCGGDLLAQLGLGRLFDLLQQNGRDLLGCEHPVAQGHHDRLSFVVHGAHLAFDFHNRALRKLGLVVLGDLPHRNLAVLLQTNHGGQCGVAVQVDRLRSAVDTNPRGTIGCAQVDADDCHNMALA